MQINQKAVHQLKILKCGTIAEIWPEMIHQVIENFGN